MTDAPETPSPVEEVAQRLTRFGHSRNPSDLWPGLTEPARVAAARELERVTRAVLAGETPVRLDPAGAHDAYALHVAGHTTGVGPVVGAWAERGTVDGAPELRRRFAEQLRHARLRAARIEREAIPALDALQASGQRPVVLKGFHTSRVYFEEPGLRRMADVDVLVPADRTGDAEAVMRGAGFQPDSPALRPYRRDWIGCDVDPGVYSLEFADERSRWVLELHGSLNRVFDPATVARLDSERACVEPMELAGRSVLVLRQPLLLLQLACHCSQELDASRLFRLLEIVLVIRHDLETGRLDWHETLAMLRRTGAARFAYPALALAEDLAPGTVDARVLALGRRESTWAARHTIARLVPAGGSPDDRGVLRQWMWTRGPAAVLQRVLYGFWPAALTRPRDVIPGWRARVRRARRGLLSFSAPDERGATPR